MVAGSACNTRGSGCLLFLYTQKVGLTSTHMGSRKGVLGDSIKGKKAGHTKTTEKAAPTGIVFPIITPRQTAEEGSRGGVVALVLAAAAVSFALALAVFVVVIAAKTKD